MILTGSISKGVIMGFAVTLLAAQEPYWHQVLLVVISSTATALALIVSAFITSQRWKRTERKVDDLKASRGLVKRREDTTDDYW